MPKLSIRQKKKPHKQYRIQVPNRRTCFVNPFSYQKDYRDFLLEIDKENKFTIKWKQRIILLEEEELFFKT